MSMFKLNKLFMLNLTKNVFQIHTEERIHEMFVDIFMNFILDGLCLSAKCSLSFLIILPAHSKLFSCSFLFNLYSHIGCI